jgi:hypothetical protein
MLKTLSIAAALIGFAATTLSAQAIDPDTFKVSYYSNANTAGYPDGTLRITNVGTQTGSSTDKSGNLCALIYVFDPMQELQTCCSCSITPDGLRVLSVDTDLTSNTLTGKTVFTGAVKIVSSTSCNAASPTPAAGIRAWITHIQNSAYVTETEFTDSGLSAGELASLKAKCSAAVLDGSGAGICSCGTTSGS